MGAIQRDITLSNGRTFTLTVECVTEDPETHQLEVRDLTGWTGAMQIRATADDTAVLATATVTINATTGVVTATITDDATTTMTWRSGVYDLIITGGSSETETLAKGVARFERSVTR